MKILIVDDETADRELSKDLLQPFGLCTLAENGLEGVARFQSALDSGQPFDLVFLDINMPEMGGLEALKKMRQLERTMTVPVMDEALIVMVTTMADPFHQDQALRYGGCSDYVVKPMKKNRLQSLLRDNGFITNPE